MKHGEFRIRVEFENNKIIDTTSRDPRDLDEGFSLAKMKLFGRK